MGYTRIPQQILCHSMMGHSIERSRYSGLTFEATLIQQALLLEEYSLWIVTIFS